MQPHVSSWNSQPLCHARRSLNHLSCTCQERHSNRVFTLYLRVALLITGSKRGCYSGEWLICEVPVQPWYRTYWHHQLGSQSAAWVLVYSICDTVSGMLLAVRVLRDVTAAIFSVPKLNNEASPLSVWEMSSLITQKIPKHLYMPRKCVIVLNN